MAVAITRKIDGYLFYLEGDNVFETKREAQEVADSYRNDRKYAFMGGIRVVPEGGLWLVLWRYKYG